MAYAEWSVVANEIPTTNKWNILGTNDADFDTRLDAIEPSYLAWTAFTPSWTNLTPGSGATNAGAWTSIGKTVMFRVRVTLGTSPSVGSGVSFVLPVNLHGGYHTGQRQVIGTASADDANGSGWPGVTVPFSASTVGARFINTGSGGIHSGITSSFPFTWVATDSLFLEGTYESV